MQVHGYTETGEISATIDGVIVVIPDAPGNRNRQEIAEWEAEGNTIPPHNPPAPTAADVNAERQRRILLGKSFNGVMVTGRDEDFRNLTNLALAAQIRIAGGDTTTVTAFRDGNNVNHDLTPPEVLSLWEQASAYVSTVYETSWAMKDGTGAFAGGTPVDYADDANWP